MFGKLYLVATPIGNLQDMSYRAINTLKEVGLIAAEDTRHTKKLLNYFDIQTKMTSYHEHNKIEKSNVLIEKLKEGLDIALVTDAGTPGISDPGEELVKKCIEEEIKVTSIPGPVAGINALIISGISTRRFVFEGFLSTDKKDRNYTLEKLSDEHRSIILYEAPHRLKKTLEILLKHIGDRKIAIIRELTKKFEEVYNTTLSDAIDYYDNNEPRGEYVLVIEGRSIQSIIEEEIKQWDTISIENHVDKYINKGLNKKDAMKQVAKDRGVSKREIYNYLINNE